MNGVIRRRMLVNYRIDAEVMRAYLPAPFAPKLHAGYAIGGICLIRLEHIRPLGLPGFVGVASENAAHRIAVEWTEANGETREGVYIPRRDTDSWLNHIAGGRIFPGEHQPATFRVTDDGGRIDFSMHSQDGQVAIEIEAHATDAFPATSCFATLKESSDFFQRGGVGYSVTHDPHRLDGIELKTRNWLVQPLAIDRVVSSFFDDKATFPADSVAFDHALVMRDIQHEWHGVGDKATL